MNTRTHLLAFLISIICATSAVSAEQITAQDIIRQAEELMRGTTAIGVYEMTITTPDWERTLTMRFWEDVDGEKAFVRVTDPPKERGTASLKLGNEMWTYLPGVERSMKIPPSMMSQSWMGSDLTNEDIVHGDDFVDQYEHELLDTTTVDAQPVYVIRSVPKPDAPVVWDQIVTYARVSDYLPAQQDYFDEDSVIVRRMRYGEFKEMGDRVIPTLYIVEPLTEDERGNRTTMRIVEMEFDARIPGGVFSRANLERSR